MKEIMRPDGVWINSDVVEKSFLEDNIVIDKTNMEMKEFLDRHYSSYLQQNVISNRYKTTEHLTKYYDTKLEDILTKEFIEDNMPEVKISTPIILDVIKNNKKLIHSHDGDCDGITSGAIVSKMLKGLFDYDNFEIFTSSRNDGYGVNDKVTEAILKYKDISLVMTSDHSSSDRKNLTRIKEGLNCKVIATDHHLFEEKTAPLNMDVFVNPQRDTCSKDFKDLNGTHVIYYTLLHAFLSSDIEVTEDKKNYYYYLLMYVGLTIISDCMDLKNYINRKIVIKMLTMMNSKHTKHDMFWKVTINRLRNSKIFDESTIGYNVSPIINSSGRLGIPRLGYELMVSEDLDTTMKLYDDITEVNKTRKERQDVAVKSDKNLSYNDGKIYIGLMEGSEGVQGILSNTVMFNENYKVAIIFTRTKVKDKYILQGSGRSQDENLHLKNILDNISKKHDIIITHGGHQKAIGIKIKDDMKLFYKILKEEIDKTNVKKIENFRVSSHIYSDKKLILNIFDMIDIGPFGIGFEKPNFVSDFYIESYRVFKRNKYFVTLKVKLDKTSRNSFTVFYNVKDKDIEEFDKGIMNHKYIRLVYTIGLNSYRNFNSILLNGIDMKFKKY